jgi:hypothetical protein
MPALSETDSTQPAEMTGPEAEGGSKSQ